jgi:hypothetical protein
MFGICWISLEGFPPDIHRRKSAEVLMLGFETIVRPVGWERELSGCMECLAGEDSSVSAGEAERYQRTTVVALQYYGGIAG